MLLTALVISTVSLWVLHWNMQRNFTKYVADVEMQKLDHVIHNLAGVYGVYHDWGNAIQAQILQIEGQAGPEDYDRLSRWWLRRQYDIALQQRYFEEHTLMNVAPTLAEPDPQKRQASQEELKWLEMNLPSEYRPFEGLKFPLSAQQNTTQVNQGSAQNPRPNQPQSDGKNSLFPCRTVWVLARVWLYMMPNASLWSVSQQKDKCRIARF